MSIWAEGDGNELLPIINDNFSDEWRSRWKTDNFFDTKENVFDCQKTRKLHLAIEFLYNLLDAIDTVDDVVKINDTTYRELVRVIQAKKSELIITNGQSLYFKN